MKRIIAIIIAALLLVSGIPAFADENVLLDSELTSAESCMTVTGFELTEWAAARCGYTSNRNIYVLTDSASAFMSFDAGKGAGYKTAEFLVTIHGYNTWQVDDAHLPSRILYSDNGTDWTSAADITCVKDEKTNYDGSTPHYNYTLSCTLAEEARYIKLDFTGCNAWQVFVHHVKLTGTEAPAEPEITPDEYFTDPCEAPSLPDNAYVTAQYTDMQSVNWEWNWMSENERTYITSQFTEAEDTITYTLKDNSKDIVYVELNYLEVSDPPAFSASRNGDMWTEKKGLTKTDSQSISDPMAYQWKKVTYKAQLSKGMKQVKIYFPGNYRLTNIKLGFAAAQYPYDLISLDENVSGEYKDGVWTVSGGLISKTDAVSEVTAILAVYKDGKMLSLTDKKVDLSDGKFVISSDKTEEGAEAALYIWSTRENMIAVITPPVLFK